MNRKLDAAIAEALGNEVGKDRNGIWIYEKIRSEGSLTEYVLHPLPRYSTDGRAILGLIEEMNKKGWQLQIGVYGSMITVDYWRHIDAIEIEKVIIDTTDTSLPESVALCAYKALTGEEWKDE